MDISRRMRKQKTSQIFLKRFFAFSTGSFFIFLLGAMWFLENKFAFFLLSVIIFFGMLLFNPGNVKRFFPFYRSSAYWVRLAASFVSLITTIALISRIAHS
ncbi:Hypothetical protein LUCI_1198 [Lucifera butyrica]|uniref:Uncharacterized protein n=1 Tax=Lucifera butyrica TaxID=1351585 RepID=A0A498R588_9FIRM|nr:Hypothetical protein LUCI_1198 [Lucifera butyrica]